jgi:hypothetical protein
MGHARCARSVAASPEGAWLATAVAQLERAAR